MNDIIGKRFGSLVVIKCAGSQGKNAKYLCKCDCGNTCTVLRGSLLSGDTQSCGCLKKSVFDTKKLHELAGFKDGSSASMFASKKISVANTSGHRGVTWDADRNVWKAQIKYRGKTYFLGRYPDKQSAEHARLDAEEKIGINSFVEWYKEFKKGQKGNGN